MHAVPLNLPREICWVIADVSSLSRVSETVQRGHKIIALVWSEFFAMKTTFLIFVSAAVVTLIWPCRAAPTKPIDTYDNRQDGKLNVESKISNILILFSPSALNTGNLDLANLIENAILTQTLGLRNSISRIAGHSENEENNGKTEDFIDARISSQESVAKKVEEPETKPISAVQQDFPEVVESSHLKSSLEHEKQEKSQVNTHEDSEMSNKSARSLKKVSSELSLSKLVPIEKKDSLENKVTGQNEREDSVGQADREPQELKLIGGGIENCGPDRFRDRFGICQARVEKQ